MEHDVTNEEVQKVFNNYMDGEKVEWQLLKMFFHQNGGLSRRTADGEKALGMTVKDDAITVSMITLEENDEGKFIAEEDDAIELKVDDKVKYRLIEMANKASDWEPNIDVENGIEDPENHDEMFG